MKPTHDTPRKVFPESHAAAAICRGGCGHRLAQVPQARLQPLGSEKTIAQEPGAVLMA